MAGVYVVKGQDKRRRRKTEQSAAWSMSFKYNVEDQSSERRRTEEQDSQPGSAAAGTQVSRCQTWVSFKTGSRFS